MNIPTASSNETAPPSPESITSLAPESPPVIASEAQPFSEAFRASASERLDGNSQPSVIPDLIQDPSSPRHAELVSESSSFEQALIRTADTVFKMAKTIEDTFFKLLKPISPSV